MALSTGLPTSVPQPRASTESLDSPEPDEQETPRPERRRRYVGWAVTALAGAILLVALVLPNELRNVTPAWFVRIPVEALGGAHG